MTGRSAPPPVAPHPDTAPSVDRNAVPSPDPGAGATVDLDPAALPSRRSRLVPVLITLATVAVATVLGRTAWRAYMDTPWTRDGTVRAYVVTMAAEVAGRIVELPVADNQLVHRGDLLLVIDPTDYQIAVELGEASLKQAKVDAEDAEREAARRHKFEGSAFSFEDAQRHDAQAAVAQARYGAAEASLKQARVNLDRTRIRSPADGWVTNLQARLGDYAMVGRNLIAVVDADSFWVDGYFEETKLHAIHEGDPARIKLMGHHDVVRGHVGSFARGINVANAQANAEGVATVNPIFTWVRLAQRIPVRIEIDAVPDSVRLTAGMTATVEIDPRPRGGPPASP
jgi:RND family efflux transporter MFP subunit